MTALPKRRIRRVLVDDDLWHFGDRILRLYFGNYVSQILRFSFGREGQVRHELSLALVPILLLYSPVNARIGLIELIS